MVFYPYHEQLREATGTGINANFGLWFNKLIPINNENECKACNREGDKNSAISFYAQTYNNTISRNNSVRELLQKKHLYQMLFLKSQAGKYRKLVFTAELISPLVLGLGESHPSETALVFDHNIGIPYIPASSLKGVVRFAHSMGLLEDETGAYTGRFVISKDEKEILDESNPETLIPRLFGGDLREAGETKKTAGKLIFMDAYPAELPELRGEIMTPHYKDYYGEDSNPPADYQEPNPISFLAVPEGTSFVFRVLVPAGDEDLYAKAKAALLRALKQEGVGAKNSSGFGRFTISMEDEPARLKSEFDEFVNLNSSEEEKHAYQVQKFLEKIGTIPKGSQGEIDRAYDEWTNNEALAGDREIANAFLPLVKKKKANGEYTRKYSQLREILELDEEQERGNAPATTPPTTGGLTKKQKTIVKRMENHLAKGSITNKELKKLKEHRSLAPEIYAKLQKLVKK